MHVLKRPTQERAREGLNRGSSLTACAPLLGGRPPHETIHPLSRHGGTESHDRGRAIGRFDLQCLMSVLLGLLEPDVERLGDGVGMNLNNQ